MYKIHGNTPPFICPRPLQRTAHDRGRYRSLDHLHRMAAPTAGKAEEGETSLVPELQHPDWSRDNIGRDCVSSGGCHRRWLELQDGAIWGPRCCDGRPADQQLHDPHNREKKEI